MMLRCIQDSSHDVSPKPIERGQISLSAVEMPFLDHEIDGWLIWGGGVYIPLMHGEY